MNIPYLLEHYGYIAVLIGTFLEGEAILIMAGFAAQSGYLEVPIVMLVATVGSFSGDQCYFHYGRHYGVRHLLGRFPSLDSRVGRVIQLLDRYHLPVILSIRFLYGLRIAGPIAIGMSKISWPRFLILNLVGAIIWAVTITEAGYLFGHAFELLIADFQRYAVFALAAAIVAGLAAWWIYCARRSRAKG